MQKLHTVPRYMQAPRQIVNRASQSVVSSKLLPSSPNVTEKGIVGGFVSVPVRCFFSHAERLFFPFHTPVPFMCMLFMCSMNHQTFDARLSGKRMRSGDSIVATMIALRAHSMTFRLGVPKYSLFPPPYIFSNLKYFKFTVTVRNSVLSHN